MELRHKVTSHHATAERHSFTEIDPWLRRSDMTALIPFAVSFPPGFGDSTPPGGDTDKG